MIKKGANLEDLYLALNEWEKKMFFELMREIGASPVRDFVKLTGAKNFEVDEFDEHGSVSFEIPRGKCRVRGTKRIVLRYTRFNNVEVMFLNSAGKKVGGIAESGTMFMKHEFCKKTGLETSYPSPFGY